MRLRELKHWPKLADSPRGPAAPVYRHGVCACRGDTGLAAKVLGTDVAKSE